MITSWRDAKEAESAQKQVVKEAAEMLKQIPEASEAVTYVDASESA